MSNAPSIEPLMDQLLGGGVDRSSSLTALVANASGIVFGSNPAYSVTDFLSVYPKFGPSDYFVQTGIRAATIGTPGDNYVVGDQLYPTQTDAAGAVFLVTSVNTSGGVTGIALQTDPAGIPVSGSGYSITNSVPTTSNSNNGSGCQVNITGLGQGMNPASAAAWPIPQIVLQLYLNLASSCVQQLRWGTEWAIATSWFCAHYCTLWLRSEGTTATTAGQIAASGLEAGIKVSKSAGGVSAGIETVTDIIKDFGAFAETTYGVQYASRAIAITPPAMWIF